MRFSQGASAFIMIEPHENLRNLLDCMKTGINDEWWFCPIMQCIERVGQLLVLKYEC
jgi:hypothetical protein